MRTYDTSYCWIFSPPITQHMKQQVECAARHRTSPEQLLNLFWWAVAWYNVSPCTERGWHDATLLCFGFPLHLDCMAFGARPALVVLQTLLKSLKCDCIKIIRNHKHIHILIIMQSREGEGRKYEIPLKSCQHRSKYKRYLKWEHTVPDWRNYQYTSYPYLGVCCQFSFIYFSIALFIFLLSLLEVSSRSTLDFSTTTRCFLHLKFFSVALHCRQVKMDC